MGICGDVQQHSGLSGDEGPLSMEPTVYLPASQLSDGFVKLIHTWFSPKWVVRTSGPTANLTGQIRAAVYAADPRLPIAHFRTIDELRGRYTGSQRYLAALFSILAGLALLLAAIGLYGLISQSITQRKHEIGIRLALGATARQTIAGVMRPGILLSIAGIGAGLGMSLVAVRFLRSLLWGVRETDPMTFVATAGNSAGGGRAGQPGAGAADSRDGPGSDAAERVEDSVAHGLLAQRRHVDDASTTSAVLVMPSSRPASCASLSPRGTTTHPVKKRRSWACCGDRLTWATTGAGTNGTTPSSKRALCSAHARRSFLSAATRTAAS